MALIRITLDLALPEAVYYSIPDDKRQAAAAMIRGLKALAVKINEGLPSEEDTTKAVWHRCLHDEGGVCGPYNDI